MRGPFGGSASVSFTSVVAGDHGSSGSSGGEVGAGRARLAQPCVQPVSTIGLEEDKLMIRLTPCCCIVAT